MFGIVDRYVSADPRPRLAVAATSVTLGVPVTLYAFFALWWPIQQWMYVGRLGSVLVLLAGIFAVAAGNHLLKDVAERASAAEPADEAVAEEASPDPVSTLQRRYVAGELTDAEFERKMERLTELDRSVEPVETGTVERALE